MVSFQAAGSAGIPCSRNTKPRAIARGLSVMRSKRSVPGADGALTEVEQVRQPDIGGVGLLLDESVKRVSRRVREKGHRQVVVAVVRVAIFGTGHPARREHPIDTATDGPAQHCFRSRLSLSRKAPAAGSEG